MNPETECLEETWHGFSVGTHREEVWELAGLDFQVLILERDAPNGVSFKFRFSNFLENYKKIGRYYL